MKKIFFLLTACSLMLGGSLAQADTLHVITPYVGPITNKVVSTTTGSEIEDQALMEGIYYQQINPESYQWNAFLYMFQDINQSDLYGGHIIFDKYFKKTDKGHSDYYPQEYKIYLPEKMMKKQVLNRGILFHFFI